MSQFCRRCGWAEPKAKGLCGTCHQYERRTGDPRPATHIQRHLTRVLNKPR